MPLYTRDARVRGTLFPADDAPETQPLPRVLRGADALRALPVDAAAPLPGVLRGKGAALAAQPFVVAALTPTPAFALADEGDEADDGAPAFEPAAPPPPVLDENAVAAIRAEEAARWQARLEEAALRARENGYKQGRDDAERAVADERALMREHVAQQMEQMQAAWHAHLAATEQQMADLAFGVAESVLAAPLPDNIRRVSMRALHEAVESLGGAGLRVAAHPVDVLRLQETGADEEMRRIAPDLRFDPDPTLHEGDWTVASDAATVRNVRAELLDALRRRLGLLALGKG